MAVRLLRLFTLVLLSPVRPALSFSNDLLLDNLLRDTTLFRDIFKLARRAAGGQCHCQASSTFDLDGFRKKKLLDLAVQLEQLLLQESVTNAFTGAPFEKFNVAHGAAAIAGDRKRVKRFHFSVRKRIAFPPGTKISMTPTFHLPFVRDMPDGLISNMTISFPFQSNAFYHCHILVEMHKINCYNLSKFLSMNWG